MQRVKSWTKQIIIINSSNKYQNYPPTTYTSHRLNNNSNTHPPIIYTTNRLNNHPIFKHSTIYPPSIHHLPTIYPPSIHHLSTIYPPSTHHLSTIYPPSIHPSSNPIHCRCFFSTRKTINKSLKRGLNLSRS